MPPRSFAPAASAVNRDGHRPASGRRVPIGEHSRWVAVRAFCRGAALGEPRDVYASRWRYIRGLPIATARGLPAGVLTVSSMLSEGETMLDRMPDTIEAAFDETLRDFVVDLLALAAHDPDSVHPTPPAQ